MKLSFNFCQSKADKKKALISKKDFQQFEKKSTKGKLKEKEQELMEVLGEYSKLYDKVSSELEL